MKKITVYFLFLIFLFTSCANNSFEIRNVIKQYQDGLNNLDHNAVISLSYDQSAAEYAMLMYETMQKNGVDIKVDISIMEIKIKNDIAEVRVKTTYSFFGDDATKIAVYKMLIPQIADSILTLKKINSNWLIVEEKVLE